MEIIIQFFKINHKCFDRLCLGNIAGRGLVGAVPPQCGSMVSATRIVASLQRCRADGSDPFAASASAFGIAPTNHHG